MIGNNKISTKFSTVINDPKIDVYVLNNVPKKFVLRIEKYSLLPKIPCRYLSKFWLFNLSIISFLILVLLKDPYQAKSYKEYLMIHFHME